MVPRPPVDREGVLDDEGPGADFLRDDDYQPGEHPTNGTISQVFDSFSTNSTARQLSASRGLRAAYVSFFKSRGTPIFQL